MQAGLPPANDRMLTTCFLAAVFHGIVILGVTFSSSNRDAGGPDAPALEVVLVGEQAPRAQNNPNARYLAERTQTGSGNLATGRTLIPASSPAPLDRAGIPGGDPRDLRAGTQTVGDDDVVAAHAPALKILYFAAAGSVASSYVVPDLLEKRPDYAMPANDDGVQLHMRGEPRQQLWVAADTRESDIAVYLDAWRRKIERVGTMNFPDVARHRNMSGTPVIEVTIGADGRLLGSVIRHSSGHAELDQAAQRILKLAAPYDAFPSALGAHHDRIRIAYEWQFLGGAAQGSSVFYAAPDPVRPTQ